MVEKVVTKEIKLNKKEGSLYLNYEKIGSFLLSGEYLRVNSPSAEVKGHGKGQGILQDGKKFVKITAVESIGNYAVRLTFSDTHNSGIYSWNFLYNLAVNYDSYWNNYLDALNNTGKYRDPNRRTIRLV